MIYLNLMTQSQCIASCTTQTAAAAAQHYKTCVSLCQKISVEIYFSVAKNSSKYFRVFSPKIWFELSSQLARYYYGCFVGQQLDFSFGRDASRVTVVRRPACPTTKPGCRQLAADSMGKPWDRRNGGVYCNIENQLFSSSSDSAIFNRDKNLIHKQQSRNRAEK